MLYNPRYENRRALIVGINKYKYVSPLVFACNDAEVLFKTLVDEFGFVQG